MNEFDLAFGVTLFKRVAKAIADDGRRGRFCIARAADALNVEKIAAKRPTDMCPCSPALGDGAVAPTIFPAFHRPSGPEGLSTRAAHLAGKRGIEEGATETASVRANQS
ncbi:hypothetical protein [Bradyrhizobium glycinis]|uniref:hypothetical protein n=1 Tax=Bradyrhizobium glycinis TaxID=2751812 RepID=UPI0018D6B9A9|nr:hypothetical protein [Bradyrhizobium glycinis]MBH5371578.1 hypothetical protein [Bradyrhizobium glycinis]